MNFFGTSLDGVWRVELEPRQDERGFFARTYCEKEFSARALNTRWPQCNLTRTNQRGTIRGLHFQANPLPEIKLVRCTAGAIYDVVVDVRPLSPTFGQWESFELTALNFQTLYIPAGFAHGFQCLADDSEVFYQMSEFYAPELARGILWNDPNIAIHWPIAASIVSERDQRLPLLTSLT